MDSESPAATRVSSGRIFRPDVRLVNSPDGVRTGLQRGINVVWLPAEIGRLVWRLGPECLGDEFAALLEDAGVSTRTPSRSYDEIDRNAIFAQALCGPGSDMADFVQTQFAVLGCGGLGSAIAIQLAALGARNLVLTDRDRVERSNLNRLIGARTSDIGRLKTEWLGRYLLDHFGIVARTLYGYAGRDLSAHTILRQTGDSFLVLSGDSSNDVRSFLKDIFTSGYPVRPFAPAGYVGQFCVAGPLVRDRCDPCPFCHAEALIADDGGFVAPSAMPNNAVIAGFITSQLLIELTSGESVLRGRRWVFDLVSGQSRLVQLQKDILCSVCG